MKENWKMLPASTLVYVILFASLRQVRCELLNYNGELPKGTPPFPGSPWPMPRTWTRHDTVNSFNPWNYTVSSNIQGCDLIDFTLRRFRKFVQSEGRDMKTHATSSNVTADSLTRDEILIETDGVVEKINIRVLEEGCPGHPQHWMKEDYNLTVSGEILLEASSAWGVMRGLTTLQQLLYTVRGEWYINDARIEDSPRFPYRGLHLDTARHFYPVGIIKRNLDVMSANKLNVLHWHVVDDESFPYRSAAFPQLAEQGAFSPKHTYSRSDVEQVTDYARLHGIRVIPEFNSPGHAHSWGQAKPDLLTPCGDELRNTSQQPAKMDIFDPTKNSTFLFLEQFFTEIRNIFKDDYLHIGLDDTYVSSCWVDNSDIAAFLDVMDFGNDLSKLKSYYDERLLHIIEQLGRSSIVYEDPVSNGVTMPNNTIVSQWKDAAVDATFKSWQTNMAALLHSNVKHVIFDSCWSLSSVHGEVSWETLYSCDPTHINATDDQLRKILGGEARPKAQHMDQYNILQTLWPRVSAVSERLWSPAHVTDLNDAQLRLDQHRCRLLRHGIPASPVNAGYCQGDYNTDNARSYLTPKTTTQATTTTPTTTMGQVTTTDGMYISVVNSTGRPLTNVSGANTTSGGSTGQAEESSSLNAGPKEIPCMFLSVTLLVLKYIAEL